MGAFDDINSAAAGFNEAVMGETFTYTTPAGSATSGLLGVFNTVEAEFTFQDFSQRKDVSLVCISSKTQWGAVEPANRGTITYGGNTYTIEKIAGTDTDGEPCFELTLKVLT
jgi:hypothetical protein